jgi:hypothetical protein
LNEGRRKKEEGRRKKEEGRRSFMYLDSDPNSKRKILPKVGVLNLYKEKVKFVC